MHTLWKLTLAAALVVFIGVTGLLYSQYQKASTTLTAVRTADEETRNRYSEAIGSIAAIQDSLNAIVLGDEAGGLTSQSLATEGNLTRTESDQVMDRISQLRAGVARSKARIEELDARLRKSGMRMAGLEKMLANLKHTLATKEQMIQALAARVDSLGTQVTGLTESVAEKTHELGTVYCMMGNKRDLTRAGVVVASGGVLGLGKTLKPSGHLDETLCTTIDTDNETTLDIPARKAVVLTPQPAASYALESDGDHTVLRIIDPKEFRKVRQLVIVETRT
ncbi:MAG: hypothetical protein ACHQ52_03130 [Candidatus Eisenbacteria bacterium]